MSIAQSGVTWSTPPEADAFEGDRKNTSPWELAAKYLGSDGFDGYAVRRLSERNCHPWDTGAFAKYYEVPTVHFVNAIEVLDTTQRLAAVKGCLEGSLPPRYPGASPNFEGRYRRELLVRNPQSHDAAREAWSAIRDGNDPVQLARFGDDLAWVRATLRDPAKVQPITEKRFLYLHHRLISWGYYNKDGDWIEEEPQDRVLKDMLADPHPPLPVLTGIRAAPVFGPDAKLAMGPGYDPSSRTFIWAPGLHIPFVPRHPTADDVAHARHLIEVELLGDFPFEDEASLAHAVCALLHPFVRPMVTGPTPIHLIDKPTPGTGGTLLADAISIVGLGLSPDVMTVGKLEDEWRFRMVALLRGGPPIVLLDNINEMLQSATLAAMVTAPDTYTDRVIKSSDTVTVPIRCLWLLTGNNVRLSLEMARRSVLIRLDANVENPESRTEFRHPYLTAWVREHRGELVWAALVLIQNWITLGCPKGKVTKGSFESWAETMGGILEVAGVPGFLANTDKLRKFADAEGDAWKAFVAAWFERHGTKSVSAGDLLDLAQENLSAILDLDGGAHSVSTKWGIALGIKRGAVIGDFKVVEGQKRQGAARWRLDPVSLKGASGEGAVSDANHESPGEE